ncbi:hypothetical protein JCM33374_g5861 [Metschnikowia sp. JCM 33374]|nr:hypothetical protein JCM33374_g5861 [Metschnikowia sp. JCM 33374]
MRQRMPDSIPHITTATTASISAPPPSQPSVSMSQQARNNSGNTSAEALAELSRKLVAFRVAELKELCKSTGLTTAGRKQDLIDRLQQFIQSLFIHNQQIEILAMQTLVVKLSLNSDIPPLHQLVNAVKSGTISYEQLAGSMQNYSAYVHPQNAYVPPNINAAARQGTTQANTPSSMAAYGTQVNHPQQSQSHAQRHPSRAYSDPNSDVYNGPMMLYRSTLFYTLRHSMGRVQVLRASKGRAFKSFYLGLTSQWIELLRSSDRMRVFLFSCAESTPDPKNAILSFPPIEIYVDGTLTKQNVRGIKGKPGTARPADLTPYIKQMDKPFSIKLVYSDAAERFIIDAYIAEVYTPETIMASVANKPHISLASSKQAIIEENERNEIDDIVVDNVPLSLRCPITYARITHPVKSIQCDHVQCFDGLSFLMMQERIPVWQCPVCSKSINENSLAVSDYLKEILENTPEEVDTVLVNGDGSWTPKHETDEPESKSESKPKVNSPTAHVPTATPAEESIEIISLDSDSETEPEVAAPNDVTMEPAEEPTVSAPHNTTEQPSEQPPVIPEDTTMLDTTMNPDVSIDHQTENPNPRSTEESVCQTTQDVNKSPNEQNEIEATSDDEILPASHRRKRVRLSPEIDSPIEEAQSVSNPSTASVADGTSTPHASNAQQSKETSQNRSAGTEIEHSESFLEDIPISQHLAQRNNPNGGVSQKESIGKGIVDSRNTLKKSSKDTGDNVGTNPVHESSQTILGDKTTSISADPAVSNQDEDAPLGESPASHQEINQPHISKNNEVASVPSHNTTVAHTMEKVQPQEITKEKSVTSVPVRGINPTITGQVANGQAIPTENPVTDANIESEPTDKTNEALNLTQTISNSVQEDHTSQGSHRKSLDQTSVVTEHSGSVQGTALPPTDKDTSKVTHALKSPISGSTPPLIQSDSYEKAADKEPATVKEKNVLVVHNSPQVSCDNPSIPVLWQSKENHSKGLERLTKANSHQHTLSKSSTDHTKYVHSSIPGELSVSHGDGYNTETRMPVHSKAPNDISIIDAIQDQISRSCSPRPQSNEDISQENAHVQTGPMPSMQKPTSNEVRPDLPTTTNKLPQTRPVLGKFQVATQHPSSADRTEKFLENDTRGSFQAANRRSLLFSRQLPRTPTVNSPVMEYSKLSDAINGVSANSEGLGINSPLPVQNDVPTASASSHNAMNSSTSARPVRFVFSHNNGSYDQDAVNRLNNPGTNHSSGVQGSTKTHSNLQVREFNRNLAQNGSHQSWGEGGTLKCKFPYSPKTF